MNKLIVTSEPSRLPIVVRNSVLSVIGQGSSPLEIEVEPGLYMATALRTEDTDISELVLVTQGNNGKVHFASDKPSFAQRALSGLLKINPTRSTDLLPVEMEASSASPAASIGPPTDFRIRFIKLEDWASWRVIDLPILGYKYRRGRATVEIAITQSGILFAQVESEFGGPLNVELPPLALLPVTRCRLVVTPARNAFAAQIRLAVEEVDAAAQHLSRGHVGEAKAHLSKANTGSDAQELPSLFHNALRSASRVLRMRTTEPATALLDRYIRLRSGEDDFTDNLHSLLDRFENLPDGYVIRAERLARKGQHKDALDLLLKIENANLPLFTEGFSLLVTRLRQYAQQRFATQEIDDSGARRAHDLLDKLFIWAPFVDLRSVTLTFPGIDPTRPSEERQPSDAGSVGWSRIIPDSIFAGNATRL
jgi:hypothetical protein